MELFLRDASADTFLGLYNYHPDDVET